MINIPKLKDLTNLKIGRWTVKYRSEDRFTTGGYRRTFWHCVCECGNEKDVSTSSLLSNNSKSCGCLHREIISKRTTERHKENRSIYDLTGDFGIGYTYDGNYFYFDIEDYKRIKDYNWFKNDQDYLLARIVDNEKSYGFSCIRLHRLIMNINDVTVEIDHIHGKNSRHDNRKVNLRFATHSQNSQNKSVTENNTSGITGVDYFKATNQWRARISSHGVTYDLGYFNKFEDAVRARSEGEDKYHKEWAYKNSISKEVW